MAVMLAEIKRKAKNPFCCQVKSSVKPSFPFYGTSGAASGESESDASSVPKSEEEKRNSAEPKKSQRGRKRRTEPIVVEKEDGTKEEVSPQVYRRLRR